MTRITIVLVPLRVNTFYSLKEHFDSNQQMTIGPHRHTTYHHFAFTPSHVDGSSQMVDVALLLHSPAATTVNLTNLTFRYADYVCIVDGHTEDAETENVGIEEDGRVADVLTSLSYASAFTNGIPLLVSTTSAAKAARFEAYGSKFAGLKTVPLPPLSSMDVGAFLNGIESILPPLQHFEAIEAATSKAVENGTFKHFIARKPVASIAVNNTTAASVEPQIESASAATPSAPQQQKQDELLTVGNTSDPVLALSAHVSDYEVRCALPTRLSFVCTYAKQSVHLLYLQQGTLSVGEVLVTADPASYLNAEELQTIAELRVFPTTISVQRIFAGQFVCVKLSGGKSMKAMDLLTWGSAVGTLQPLVAYPNTSPTILANLLLQPAWVIGLTAVPEHNYLKAQASSGYIVAKDGIVPQSALAMFSTSRHLFLEMGTGVETNSAPLNTHLHFLPSSPLNGKLRVLFMASKNPTDPLAYSVQSIDISIQRSVGFFLACNELRADGSIIASPCPVAYPFKNDPTKVATAPFDKLAEFFTNPIGNGKALEPKSSKTRFTASLVEGLLADAPCRWLVANGFINTKMAEEKILPPEFSVIALLCCLKLGPSKEEERKSSKALATAITFFLDADFSWSGLKRLFANFFSQKMAEPWLEPIKQREAKALSSLLKASTICKHALQRISDALSAHEKGRKICETIQRDSLYALISSQGTGAAFAIGSCKGGWTWEYMYKFYTAIPNVKPYLLLYATVNPAESMRWFASGGSTLPAHTIAVLDRWASSSGLTPLARAAALTVSVPLLTVTPYGIAVMYLFANVCRVKNYKFPISVMHRIAMYVSIGR